MLHLTCVYLCRPLVDPTDRGDRGSSAPEDDGPGDRDGESQPSSTVKHNNTYIYYIILYYMKRFFFPT